MWLSYRLSLVLLFWRFAFAGDYNSTTDRGWWWDRSSTEAVTNSTDAPWWWWDTTPNREDYTTSWWDWYGRSTTVRGPSNEVPPYENCGQLSSCAELFLSGVRNSGVHTVFPRKFLKASPFQVYCDMDTDGGGWTVFQRRDLIDKYHKNRVSFRRTWREYADGFGNLMQEFWLGNDHLHLLTTQDNVELRVEIEDWNGKKKEARYSKFRVADAADNYRLDVNYYEGDAGDALRNSPYYSFSTFDRSDWKGCGYRFQGGWWHSSYNCEANLNGPYLSDDYLTSDGVLWLPPFTGYAYSLKKAEMKVRPTYFDNCTSLRRRK